MPPFNSALFVIFFTLSLPLIAQGNQTVINNKAFNSVFSKVKTGNFNGTANGVLFIRNTELQEVILDFQGSKARLNIEAELEEVYDVSTKRYRASTTSGKTSIEYNTYPHAGGCRWFKSPDLNHYLHVYDVRKKKTMSDLKTPACF